MLKNLFYATASILMLTLAYQLGARGAQAQSAGPVEGSAFFWTGVGSGVRASGTVGRVFYLLLENGQQRTYSPPIPGTQPIVATDPMGIDVLLADGQVLRYDGSGWAHLGDLVGGATPALRQSWGQLKAQHNR